MVTSKLMNTKRPHGVAQILKKVIRVQSRRGKNLHLSNRSRYCLDKTLVSLISGAIMPSVPSNKVDLQ